MAKRFIILEGQSNCTGVGSDGAGGAPAGLPDATVQLWRHVNQIGTTAYYDAIAAALDTTPVSSTYFGIECQLGKDLRAAGVPSGDLIILKACANGTSVKQWLPSDASEYWALLKTGIIAARPRSGDYTVHLVSIRGEYESVDATDAGALSYAADYTTYYNAIAGELGVTPRRHVCRVRAAVTGGTHVAIVRAQQAAIANYLINTDDLTTTDGTHLDPPSINTLGSRVATSIRTELGI
jgi:hypothetical protein